MKARSEPRHNARMPVSSRRCRAAVTAILATLILGLAWCAAADATIYWRSGTTNETGSGAASITLSAPANTAVGDLLIMSVDAEGTTLFSAPTGWTSIYAGATSYSSCCTASSYAIVYYRIATSADIGASYTIILGSSRKAVGRLGAYVGVDTAAPIQATGTATGFANTTSITYPSITTSVANELVIMGGTVYNSTGTFTTTTPPGTTNRASLRTSGSGSAIGGDTADFVQATAGATGTKTGAISPSSAWGAITIGLKPAATGVLQFSTAPKLPASLPPLTLDGTAQTLTSRMNGFGVDDTIGSGSGWNVTVNGDNSAGHSPVFARYCPNPICGSDTQGYVAGGASLAAGSLSLTSTGASWSTAGGSGTAPAFQCGSGCTLDSSSPTKVVSAASGGGLGPWTASGFGASSLTQSAPTTVRALPASEVYHADFVWTLATGP